MIEIKVVTDQCKTLEILKKHGLSSGEVLAATDKEDIIAYTVFSINGTNAYLHHIVPEDDTMLADGMIRSTVHVVLSRGACEVYYKDSVNEELLNKLSFILDREKKLLDSDKLYRACCCEKNTCNLE